jgi:hypothetical protein
MRNTARCNCHAKDMSSAAYWIIEGKLPPVPRGQSLGIVRTRLQ